MNERIKELALEVFSFKYKTYPNELNPGHNMDHIYKFAELIVKECVKEIEFQYGGGSDQPMDNEWDRAIECVSSMVKYRFGVENA